MALLLLPVAANEGSPARLRPAAWPSLAIAAIAPLAFMACFPETHLATAKPRDFYHRAKATGQLVLHPERTSQLWQIAEADHRGQLENSAFRALVADAELDVHGFHQGLAILGGYRYVSRPIPQGYSAYTPRLAARNADWLAARRPPFSLVKIETIDNRLPALDDALCLTWMLQNYRIAKEGQGTLLLSLSSDSHRQNPTIVTRSVEVGLGDWHTLPLFSGRQIRYLKLDADLTPAGKIARFFLPIRPLQIEVKFATGNTEVYSVPLQMGRTGFAVYPFIRSTADVREWIERQRSEIVVALRFYSQTAGWLYRKNARLTLSAESESPLEPPSRLANR